jgi:hypothetical protein
VAGRSGALQRVTPVALVGYVRSPDQWSFSSMNAIDSISSAFQRGYLTLIEREVQAVSCSESGRSQTHARE